jgi:hypothetical protein
MNAYRAILLSAALVLAGSSHSARADTSSGGDGPSWLMLFGGTIVTGINLLTMGLSSGREGSEVLGITGAVIGTSLLTYSALKDLEGGELFMAGGAITAAVGAASFFIARDNNKQAQAGGLHMMPCIVPGNEHAAGLELSYRW